MELDRGWQFNLTEPAFGCFLGYLNFNRVEQIQVN